jgi:hypothetical protein
MVAPTCFGITLPSSGSIPSTFWEMLNWGEVDRILWMGVLCISSGSVPSAFWEMLNWGAVYRILWMDVHPLYSVEDSSIEHLSEGTTNAPWWWQFNAETCRSYHTQLINWINNWCICWLFTHIFTARRLYKSFGVKGLTVSRLGTVRKFKWGWIWNWAGVIT